MTHLETSRRERITVGALTVVLFLALLAAAVAVAAVALALFGPLITVAVAVIGGVAFLVIRAAVRGGRQPTG